MAELWEQNWNRLPMGAAVNVRELGGYPTKDGGRTNYHRFLRSCALIYTTPEEREFLHRYGVRCTIDLRGQTEHDGNPEPFIASDVETHHVPLYEVNIADVKDVDLNSVYGGADPTITDVYRQIVERYRSNIGRVFKIMAAAPEGVVFFSCTVGKDRTGVIAMLLLMLCGCDKYDCISNYQPSGTHLRRWQAILDMYADPNITENSKGQLDSTFESGEFLYDMIENEFGGAENYLLGAGVTPEETEAVRQRLIG